VSKELAKLQISTAEDMHEFGSKLAGILKAGDLVILTGPLGAGKTTFTRGVGEGLQAIGNVSSPTFVIARTHKRENSEVPLVHVDAYRLSSVHEFDDLDIDIDHSIVLVEWGRGFAEELAESWLDIEIGRDHTGESDIRDVTITAHGSRFENARLSL
jgi:tRNA threonylcarbamoyl adenosine modification protein YjeE